MDINRAATFLAGEAMHEIQKAIGEARKIREDVFTNKDPEMRKLDAEVLREYLDNAAKYISLIQD